MADVAERGWKRTFDDPIPLPFSPAWRVFLSQRTDERCEHAGHDQDPHGQTNVPKESVDHEPFLQCQHRDDATVSAHHVQTMFGCRRKRFKIEADKKWLALLTTDKSWRRPFDDPIILPNGRELVTLEDAGTYITKLPKAEHEAPERQAAGRLTRDR